MNSAFARKLFWPAVLVGLAAAIVLAVLGVTAPGSANYSSVNKNFPGLPTAITSSVLRLTVYVSAALTIGGLVVGTVLIPARSDGTITPPASKAFGAAGAFGLLWAFAACVLIVVDAADTNGLSAMRGLSPEGLMTMIGASNLPKAWIITTLGAGVVGFTAAAARTWRAGLGLLIVAGLSVLPPIVSGHVAVNANHDFETDAAMFSGIAVAGWFGVVLIAGTHVRKWGLTASVRTRMRRVVGWSLAVVVAGDLVVDVFELAGTNPLDSATGKLMIARMALLMLVCALQALQAPRPDAAVARFAGPLQVMLGFGYLGVTAAMARIPPPRYFTQDVSIQKTLLGYVVPDSPTVGTLIESWRVNILFTVLAVAAVVAYVVGVRRVGRWPVARTISWIVGWALVVLVTSGGLGVYSPASFSMHMLTGTVLNMIAPLLLVLAAPITLALDATCERHPFAGGRQLLRSCLHSPMMRVLANPVVIYVIFIAAYFGLYLTPLFTNLMIFHWGHQLVRLFFLCLGFLFFLVVVGADESPKPLPPLGRLAFVFAMMPFHAVFAIVVMSTDTIIGYTYFKYLDPQWMTNLGADQFAGGVIDWIGGELSLVAVVIVLLIGWMRQERRGTTALDHHHALAGARS